jgi:hypothetical protein
MNGQRYRASLDTRDWQRAIRKLAALEDPRAPEVKSVEDAIDAFENHIHPLEAATQRKYKNVMAQLREYCERTGIGDVMQITVERLDAYRAGRKLSPTTRLGKGNRDLSSPRCLCWFSWAFGEQMPS